MSDSTIPMRVTPIQATNIGNQYPGRHLKSPVPKTSTPDNNVAQPTSSEVPPPFMRANISDHLVGPPPSFEANILEVETDIAFAFRRAEAARENARNSHAIDPSTPPELSANPARKLDGLAELAGGTQPAKSSKNRAE